MSSKKPVSVLVVIHTASLQVLLLERAANEGYWQSVTGSQEEAESLVDTARREVREETGIDAPVGAFVDWHLANRFEIFPIWRARYADGVTHNVEHVFSLCVADDTCIHITPDEHRSWHWLGWQHAVAKCFSWTNRDAIAMLPLRTRVERFTSQ